MNTFLIDSRELYEYARSRGYEPLIQTRFFRLEIGLRKELQRERFGNGHTPEENEKFYRWMWANKPHYCEECMRPLAEYSAVYVSHILTRGANPDMAHDPEMSISYALGIIRNGRTERGSRCGFSLKIN